MIHTVKGFGVVNIAEVDVFLELSCFFSSKKQESVFLFFFFGWQVQTAANKGRDENANKGGTIKKQ